MTIEKKLINRLYRPLACLLVSCEVKVVIPLNKPSRQGKGYKFKPQEVFMISQFLTSLNKYFETYKKLGEFRLESDTMAVLERPHRHDLVGIIRRFLPEGLLVTEQPNGDIYVHLKGGENAVLIADCWSGKIVIMDLPSEEYLAQNKFIRVEVGRSLHYPGCPTPDKRDDYYTHIIDFEEDYSNPIGIEICESEVIGKQSYSTPSFGWQECDVVEVTHYRLFTTKEYELLQEAEEDYADR